MFRTSLLFCVIVSAGLLSGPADARERHKREHDADRQAQQDQRRERDNERERDQPREQEREERELRQPPLLPEPLRAGPRGDTSALAARRAQQRNGGGRVLSVDPEGRGYRVKVLKDGEVRTHHVEDE